MHTRRPTITSGRHSCNKIWAPSSKFCQVLQYYSTLLEGTGSRLRLLWQLSGCGSLQQWIAERPDEALELRSQVLLAAMNVERRYLATLDNYPFKLLALADPRRADHDEILDAFYAKPSCCWKAGFARELRSTFEKDEFLQQLPTLRWLFLMAAFFSEDHNRTCGTKTRYPQTAGKQRHGLSSCFQQAPFSSSAASKRLLFNV